MVLKMVKKTPKSEDPIATYRVRNPSFLQNHLNGLRNWHGGPKFDSPSV